VQLAIPKQRPYKTYPKIINLKFRKNENKAATVLLCWASLVTLTIADVKNGGILHIGMCRSVDLPIDFEIYRALRGVRYILDLGLKVVLGALRTVYQTKNRSHC
jgi:hypothetical protein